MSSEKVYNPTPEVIQAELAKIQATWTDEERHKRYVGDTEADVNVKHVHDPGQSGEVTLVRGPVSRRKRAIRDYGDMGNG